ADSSSSAQRRSAAFNLMGVLQFSQTLPSSDEAARNATIREGVGDFRNALELDATNDDAKLNLELAARLYREELTGPPISGGPSWSRSQGPCRWRSGQGGARKKRVARPTRSSIPRARWQRHPGRVRRADSNARRGSRSSCAGACPGSASASLR